MDEHAKYSMPLFFMSCGMTHEKPNVSGIHSTLQSSPNSRRIKRLPNSTCRTSDSPPVRLVSLSTHQPPVTSHCPDETFSLIRAYRSGSSSLTNWYSCGVECR